MKPLSHLVMLDLTHMLSGPFATMVLADLGVRTIKVEPPGKGEATRRLLADSADYAVDGMGAYFLTLGRNKESICLDLKADEGREVFYALAEKADIVFDNFSPGVTERLGIGHETLAARNPRIVTCSVTGFGQTGPGRDRTAFDMVAQGMGGGMSITGTEESGPMRAGIPIGDLGGGMFGIIGVLTALIERDRTGRGRHVDISMLDGQIALLNYMATMYFLSGKVPGPEGNGHFTHVPYNTFRTTGRHLILAVVTDAQWQALIKALGLPELDEPRYAHAPGRLAGRTHIEGEVQAVLEKESCEHWLGVLGEVRVPCAPVNDFAHALADEQVRARNMVVEVAHPGGRTVEQPGNPVKLVGAEVDSYAPPPLVGQHTDSVLGDLLGLSESERAALRAKGAIG